MRCRSVRFVLPLTRQRESRPAAGFVDGDVHLSRLRVTPEHIGHGQHGRVGRWATVAGGGCRSNDMRHGPRRCRCATCKPCRSGLPSSLMKNFHEYVSNVALCSPEAAAAITVTHGAGPNTGEASSATRAQRYGILARGSSCRTHKACGPCGTSETGDRRGPHCPATGFATARICSIGSTRFGPRRGAPPRSDSRRSAKTESRRRCSDRWSVISRSLTSAAGGGGIAGRDPSSTTCAFSSGALGRRR